MAKCNLVLRPRTWAYVGLSKLWRHLTIISPPIPKLKRLLLKLSDWIALFMANNGPHYKQGTTKGKNIEDNVDAHYITLEVQKRIDEIFFIPFYYKQTFYLCRVVCCCFGRHEECLLPLSHVKISCIHLHVTSSCCFFIFFIFVFVF